MMTVAVDTSKLPLEMQAVFADYDKDAPKKSPDEEDSLIALMFGGGIFSKSVSEYAVS